MKVSCRPHSLRTPSRVDLKTSPRCALLALLSSNAQVSGVVCASECFFPVLVEVHESYIVTRVFDFDPHVFDFDPRLHGQFRARLCCSVVG